MAADYGIIFGTLSKELKNLRKPEAQFENFHYTDDSNDAKRLTGDEYDITSVLQEAASTAASTAYENAARGAQGTLSTLRTAFENGWFPVLDGQIGTSPSDKSVGAIGYDYDTSLNDGTVSVLDRTGRWGALRAAMIADREVIKKNTVSAGGLSAVGSPQGSVVLTSAFGSDHTLSGTVDLVCTDDTVEAPKFSVNLTLAKKIADQNVPTSPDGLFSILTADNNLQMGRSFQDGPTGLSIQLDKAAVTVTDPSSVVSAFDILSPTEADTNKGKLYVQLARMPSEPVWAAYLYKDAAHTQLLAQASAPHASPSLFIGAPGGTGVSILLDNTNADAAMPTQGNTYDLVFDCHSPRVNDAWQFTITNSEDGLFATKIARNYRASLNSAHARPSSAPSASLAGAGAGNVNDGTHTYAYSYVVNGVETGRSDASGVVTVADHTTNGKVSVSGITVGPSGTTARKVYRTVAGNTGLYKLIATIADNTTTTYTDNTADGSLGQNAVLEIDDSQASSISIS